MNDYTKPKYAISYVANELGVHQRTLRILEAKKLLVPVRSKGNQRLYSDYDIEIGKLINWLTRELNFGLYAVAFILNYFDEILYTHDRSILENAIETIKNQVIEFSGITKAQMKENLEGNLKKGRKKNGRTD